MYTVIEAFTDLQDGNYVYISGETYPRKGYTPSEERIAELAGSTNKLGHPLIMKVDEPTDDDVLEVPIDPKAIEVYEKAHEEAKEAASDAGTGENSPKATEAKRTPKKAQGRSSKKN